MFSASYAPAGNNTGNNNRSSRWRRRSGRSATLWVGLGIKGCKFDILGAEAGIGSPYSIYGKTCVNRGCDIVNRNVPLTTGVPFKISAYRQLRWLGGLQKL